ncbi:hypothetical protein FPV67DRAFT_1453607 [Lyophyllum atratum]|nr:hypothetical protein FPV67DRAFT_1453607 [Lyophyllum atratum]
MPYCHSPHQTTFPDSFSQFLTALERGAYPVPDQRRRLGLSASIKWCLPEVVISLSGLWRSCGGGAHVCRKCKSEDARISEEPTDIWKLTYQLALQHTVEVGSNRDTSNLKTSTPSKGMRLGHPAQNIARKLQYSVATEAVAGVSSWRYPDILSILMLPNNDSAAVLRTSAFARFSTWSDATSTTSDFSKYLPLAAVRPWRSADTDRNTRRAVQ